MFFVLLKNQIKFHYTYPYPLKVLIHEQHQFHFVLKTLYSFFTPSLFSYIYYSIPKRLFATYFTDCFFKYSRIFLFAKVVTTICSQSFFLSKKEEVVLVIIFTRSLFFKTVSTGTSSSLTYTFIN